MEFVVAEGESPKRSLATPENIRSFFRRGELWYGDEASLVASDGTELTVTCLAEAVTRSEDRGEFGLTLVEAGARHVCPRSMPRDEVEAHVLRFARGDRSDLSELQWQPARRT